MVNVIVRVSFLVLSFCLVFFCVYFVTFMLTQGDELKRHFVKFFM